MPFNLVDEKVQPEHPICGTLNLILEEAEGPGEAQALGSLAEISATNACIPADGQGGHYTEVAQMALRDEMCHRESTGLSVCVCASGENSSSTPSTALDKAMNMETRPIS